MSCVEDKVCEWCGKPADMHINDLWFCRIHIRAGAITVARLEAFKAGAGIETIRASGRFMEEELDNLGIEVLREEGDQ